MFIAMRSVNLDPSNDPQSNSGARASWILEAVCTWNRNASPTWSTTTSRTQPRPSSEVESASQGQCELIHTGLALYVHCDGGKCTQSASRIAASEEGVPAMFGGVVSLDLINAFATNRTKPNMNPPTAVPYITEAGT